MSWRENMGPASFRGAKFFLDSAERGGGRRGVTHEYPFRDNAFREDMGRRVRTFPVEGYVLGENYFADRNALLAKLEEPGTGELVHPYYGTLQVAVTDYRVRESGDEGGKAQFSITFEETIAKPAQPTNAVDAKTSLRASVDNSRTAVNARFIATYNPGVLVTSISRMLTNATRQIDSFLSAAQFGEQQLARIKAQTNELASSAGALVRAPEDMLASIGNLVDLVDSIPVLLGLYEFDPGVRPPDTTPTRLQEQVNFDASQYLIQRSALIRAAELLLDEAFVDYNSAVAAREAMTDRLDEQAELESADDYPALTDLRAQLVLAVPGTDSDLPRLLTYSAPLTVPSLVIAQRLYGNTDLELDLVARNHVRHPALVPGGRDLEVLSGD